MNLQTQGTHNPPFFLPGPGRCQPGRYLISREIFSARKVEEIGFIRDPEFKKKTKISGIFIIL